MNIGQCSDETSTDRDPKTQAIAIVGMACRLPGADTLDGFWDVLSESRETLREWPAIRSSQVGIPRAAFLDGADQFDAHFFRLSGEAAEIDPQHRLLLEVCWEALEHTGCDPFQADQGPVGVFLGMTANGYREGGGLGSALSMAAARLCHFLNWKGPAVTIDTSCSSSLVALHYAVQSLRLGESTMAIAGCANVIANPISFSRLEQLGVLAPDGRSKSFDARADGYGRGEGCVVLVLRKYADAVAQGNRIHAIIRGTAVNHDGRSSSLTAPNPKAQEDVIRRALAVAGASPADVQYVETHGTGTVLGDPIEVQGLAAVFGERSIQLAIGSVKSNIGHLEAGAGLAGLLKTVMALKNRVLPASLHFENPNPLIPWETTPIYVQTEKGPWPDLNRPLLAGVSSIGMSGTNAHVLVEEAPQSEPSLAVSALRPLILPLSARTPEALRELVDRYVAMLAEAPKERRTPADIAYTASCRRAHLEYRLAVVGLSEGDWLGKLRRLASTTVRSPKIKPAVKQGVAMIFSGQGPQWRGMGLDLFATEPVFRAAVEECAARMDRHACCSLIDELMRDEESSRIHGAEIAQPLLFALQVGLYALWKSWGVEPDVVLGYDFGEIAAAYAAEAISLDAAARLVVERARILERTAGLGKMISVDFGPSEARSLIANFPEVEIAATNSPQATVLTGSSAAIARLQEVLANQGIRWTTVSEKYAFHSTQMDVPAAELAAVLSDWSTAVPMLPLISTVSGDIAPALDAVYWGQQVRREVRFSEAVLRAQDRGCGVFIEVGPHPALLPAIAQGMEQEGEPTVLIPSMERGAPALESMLEALGTLYTAGFSVDWRKQHPLMRPVVDLPLYPWQHESFWEMGSSNLAQSSASSLASVGRHSDCGPLDEGLYEVSWKPVPHSQAQTVSGSWLLLEDAGGLGQALRARLEERGERVTTLRSSTLDSRYRPTATRDSDQSDCFDSFVNEAYGATPPAAVVYLWSLDAPLASNFSADGIDDAQRLGCLSVMHLVQALSRKRWTKSPKLFLVTYGAQAVGGGAVNICQAPLWGFGASVAREFPELQTTLIDLDLAGTSTEDLCDELLYADEEDRIALHGGLRWIARLTPHRAISSVAGRVRSDRTYLITGGLGGLGLVIARRLVERGARHIALLGRSAPTVEARHHIAALEESGARVEIAQSDVCNAQELDAAIRRIESLMPPLAGVLHAAGIVDDGLIMNLSETRIRAVMAPKVRGAWNLHESVRKKPLDFFVLFSSIVGVLGSIGQAHYAAGNAFLDALAHTRRAIGLPAQSIDWGGWRETGMGARMEPQPVRRARGLYLMSNTEGADLFERVLSDVGVIQVTAQPGGLRCDLDRPLPRLLRDLVPLRADRSELSDTNTLGALQLSWPPLNSSHEEPRDWVEKEIERIWSDLLGLSDLRIYDDFIELGGDSLVAVRMVSRIRERLGVELSLQCIFDRPTIADLAEEIRGMVM